ncbi:MAG: ankyrin repeat domain-containing protein [Chitinophagales bacterium]|nr:ankyrin repeat domain-containing protein [Chitinophagales bacterium]
MQKKKKEHNEELREQKMLEEYNKKISEAIEVGELQMLKDIMEKRGINIYEIDHLILALEKGYSDIISFLLWKSDYQGDINKTDSQGKTLLMHAAEKGNEDTILMLLGLKTKPYINTKSNEGKSAIMYAKENGHDEIVELLKKAGARD